jgi:hypothetical protein
MFRDQFTGGGNPISQVAASIQVFTSSPPGDSALFKRRRVRASIPLLELTVKDLATFESYAPKLFGEKEWQAYYQNSRRSWNLGIARFSRSWSNGPRTTGHV